MFLLYEIFAIVHIENNSQSLNEPHSVCFFSFCWYLLLCNVFSCNNTVHTYFPLSLSCSQRGFSKSPKVLPLQSELSTIDVPNSPSVAINTQYIHNKDDDKNSSGSSLSNLTQRQESSVSLLEVKGTRFLIFLL